MPVDTTKTSGSRRTQRKITEEELKDIELKRIRGELSCAECRRLKLRCDKKVPCSSCCRRGCESICPCGILSAGQGTRFILADTEQLHRKIAEMSHRIRQLEDALAILQSTVSGDRHPLLQDELLKVKFGAETLRSRQQYQEEDEEPMKQSIDALGTLTLGDSGEVKYFGRSAGSETLMMAEEDEEDAPSDHEDEQTVTPVPPEIENLANLFPFTKKDRPNIDMLEMLESFLPSHERAWSLSESYIQHGSYFFRPMKRDELLNIFLPTVYNVASARVQSRASTDASFGCDPSDDPSVVDWHSPHALATLFFMFALGALLDLGLPPYNAEAEHYYVLGCAALSLRTVFDSPEVSTVQALGLMATYHTLGGKKYSRDSAWSIMSFAAKLAQSIGLHRDSARWNMDAKTVQQRRNLFWEIMAADLSHSLALGRPPSIHLSYVDCEYPLDEESAFSDTGELQSGFWRMKHTFAKEMFMGVAEATLTAKSPSYATVLNLDRKVRELSFPASFKPYATRDDGEQDYHSSSLSLRDFYASQHRTVTMLYLHRSFFAQAMLDFPANPLLSPFAPSFLTAYRCASVVIRASVHQFDRCDSMAMRIWFLLYHTFSAAVIVGSVVTRSPNSNIATNALHELGTAIELFERTALQSQRARIALAVLLKLKEKAIRAHNQHHPGEAPKNLSPTSLGLFSTHGNDMEDELAIFGGQTRLLSRRKSHSRSKSAPGSVHTDSPSPPAEDLNSSPPDIRINSGMGNTLSNVHPSLVEYLKSGTFQEPLMNPPSRRDPSPNVEMGSNLRYPPDEVTHASSSAITPGGNAEEVYPAFMGYAAGNGPMVNAASGRAPDSAHAAYHIGDQGKASGWTVKTEHSNSNALLHGLGSAGSFGWLPSPSPQPPSQQPTSSRRGSTVLGPNVFTTTAYATSGVHGNPDITVTSSPSISSTSMNQAFPDGHGHSHSTYGGVFVSGGGYSGATVHVNSADPMIELGLSTESGMDAGWVSFMQDCGILEGESMGGRRLGG